MTPNQAIQKLSDLRRDANELVKKLHKYTCICGNIINHQIKDQITLRRKDCPSIKKHSVNSLPGNIKQPGLSSTLPIHDPFERITSKHMFSFVDNLTLDRITLMQICKLIIPALDAFYDGCRVEVSNTVVD